MLPDGFSELVSLSIENWTWDRLPRNIEEIWDSLLYQIFLGSMVKSSQASYVKRVLDKHLSFDVASSVRELRWTEKPLKTIQRERDRIIGSRGEGYKKHILGLVEQDIANGDISNTINDSLLFFEEENINTNKIKALKNDTKATSELIAAASDSIHNVSYVKSVLWMYGCGIAREIVPPNHHVKKFLAQYGFLSSVWTSGNDAADWEIFSICNKKMQEVAQLVAQDLGRQISAKQAQSAVWYLQSSRGLLSNRYSGKLASQTLVDFLNYKGWNILDFDNKIGDVEELDNLSRDITTFLRSTM